MSLQELLASCVAPVRREFKINAAGKELTFFANEIGHLQRLHVAQLAESGGDQYTQLVIYSIVDEAGQSLTAAQVNALPPEIAEKFFNEACEASKRKVEEKN